MIFWRHALTIAGHELLLERRAGETWSIILPFAGAALMVVPMALGTDLQLITQIAWPLYWAVVLLFGMQIAWRNSSSERTPVREVMILLGIDPAARFLGRVMANGLLMVGFMAGVGLLTVLLYSPVASPGPGRFALVVVLFASGLAQLSTIAADLTLGIGARAALAPLLVAPLAMPLLIGAAQSTVSVTRSGSILPWLLMLVLADLILAVVGLLTARPLEEAAT
jgi:heme exporter protein B